MSLGLADEAVEDMYPGVLPSPAIEDRGVPVSCDEDPSLEKSSEVTEVEAADSACVVDAIDSADADDACVNCDQGGGVHRSYRISSSVEYICIQPRYCCMQRHR